MGKGKGRPSRVYPEERQAKEKETTRKLKEQNRRLLKENKILASENRTLTKAWNKTVEYLGKKFGDHTLEKILKDQKEPIYYEDHDFLDTDQYENDDIISDEDRVFEYLKDLEVRCSGCGETKPEKFRQVDCKTFTMEMCGSCGHRERRNKDVGASRTKGS